MHLCTLPCVNVRQAVRAAEGSPEPEQGGSSSAEMPPEPVEPSDVDGDGVADEEDCEELVHDAGSEDASIGEAEERMSASMAASA